MVVSFSDLIVWCTLGAKPRSYVLQRHDVLSKYLESNVQAMNALPSSPLNNENSPLVASLEHLPDDKMSSLCQCSWSLLSNCLIVFWPRRASWCRLSRD